MELRMAEAISSREVYGMQRLNMALQEWKESGKVSGVVGCWEGRTHDALVVMSCQPLCTPDGLLYVFGQHGGPSKDTEADTVLIEKIPRESISAEQII